MAGGNGALGYTKFLFVRARPDDDGAGARMRTVGGLIARGFFNDFDAEGSRDTQPHEAIQFLVADEGSDSRPGLAGCRYVAQVSAKYQARLDDVEADLRRRLGDTAEVTALDGAERPPRYTSAEMYEYAYRHASVRQSGRVAGRAFLLPMSKTAEWWALTPLERQAYFYPHVDKASGCPVHGHARTAEPGIARLHRRLYHNPNGYQRDDEFDFLTYFECEEQHGCTFEDVLRGLRDTTRNPECRFVEEGPLWRGRRVLRW
jgi:hypothetical protein